MASHDETVEPYDEAEAELALRIEQSPELAGGLSGRWTPGETLRAAVEEELSERPPEAWTAFTDQVLARVEAEVEAALSERSPIDEAVRAEVAGELGRRVGEWSAFSAGVERRARASEAAESRRSLEERAIAGLREDVEAELEAVAPRLDRSFRAGVEKRLAEERPAAGRLRLLVGGLAEAVRSGPRWFVGGVGLAAAAAAAAMIFVSPSGLRDPPRGDVPGIEGVVTVDDVDFEGVVTVMNERGVAVIWLAGAEGS